MAAKNIFRKESLEKMASPEELDRLFTVVGSKAWIPMLTLASLCGLAVLWSILGKIPETVDGVGVLINPGRVRRVESSATGRITELKVKAGQEVKIGDIIAVLDQPELKQQLDQAVVRITQLKQVDASQTTIEEERLRLEQQTAEEQRRVLERAIAEAKDLAEIARMKNEKHNKDQRANLEDNEKMARELNRTLETRLMRFRSLLASRLITEDMVHAAETAFNDSKLTLSNLKSRYSELGLKEMETEQFYLQQKARVADLNLQLQQIGIRANQLKQETTQSRFARTIGIQDQKDKIEQLEKILEPQLRVTSKYAGKILEVAVQAGQLTQLGARLGSIEIEDESGASADASGTLKTLAYFQVGTGKLLEVGKSVRVTPVNVKRERYGSIIGRITRVSPFPITEEAAGVLVGNPELVHSLAQPGGMIEAEIDLERDDKSVSGYRWTSGGPALKFSSGTPASVRVTVEERRPITFLFPMLKGLVSTGG